MQAGPDRERDPAGEQQRPYRLQDQAVHSQAAAAQDDGDLSRLAKVFVPEADYDRAFQLFYAEREDEL